MQKLDWQSVHVGIKTQDIGKGQLINHLILLIKWMIFVFSKEKSRPPLIREIRERMLESREEERKLAMKRGTLALHSRKWNHLMARDTYCTTI